MPRRNVIVRKGLERKLEQCLAMGIPGIHVHKELGVSRIAVMNYAKFVKPHLLEALFSRRATTSDIALERIVQNPDELVSPEILAKEREVKAALRRLELARRTVTEPAQLDPVIDSVFNTRKALEHLYELAQVGFDEIGWDRAKYRIELLNTTLSIASQSFEVMKQMYDIALIQQFQNTVLEVLDEVDPTIKREVVFRLRQRKKGAATYIQSLIFGDKPEPAERPSEDE